MNTARELFMKYGGNRFFMDREGELETYERYAVSSVQEQVWLAEYRQILLSELTTQPTNAAVVHDFCSTVSDYQDFDAILPVVAFAQDSIGQLDSFSKIRISEELLDTMSEQNGSINPNTSEKVRWVVRLLLESTVNAPVSVAEYYRVNYPEIDDMYSDEAVRSRAKDTLAQLDSKHG